MPIYSCPKCTGQLRTDSDVSGRKVRCPHCRDVFRAESRPLVKHARPTLQPQPESVSEPEPIQEFDLDSFDFYEGERPRRRPRPSHRRIEDDADSDDDEYEDDGDEHVRMKRNRADRRELADKLDNTSRALRVASLGFILYSIAPSIIFTVLTVSIATGFLDFLPIGLIAGQALLLLGWVCQAIGAFMAMTGERRHGAAEWGIAAGGFTGLALISIPVAVIGGAYGGQYGFIFMPILFFPAFAELARLVSLMMHVSRVGHALEKPEIARGGFAAAICVPAFAVGNHLMYLLVAFILADTFGSPFTPFIGQMPLGAKVFVVVFGLGTVGAWSALFAYCSKVCRKAAEAADETL